MALDPMPYGSGEFSFTMDTSSAYLWPPAPAPMPAPTPTLTPLAQDDTHCHKHMESMAEMKERLAVATSELQTATEEMGLKDQNVTALMEIKRLIQEELHDPVLEGMASSSSDSCWSPPLQSPVAVQYPAMFNPFTVPCPAAVVADEGSSAAAALEEPSFAALVSPTAGDGRSSAAALEVPSFASLLSPTSVVAADEGWSSAAALEVPSFATLLSPTSLVADEGWSSSVALEVSSFASLLSPTSVVVADEGTSAASALQVPSFAAHVSPTTAAMIADEGRSAVLALEVPTFAAAPCTSRHPPGRPQYHSAHVVKNRSAAAALEMAYLEVQAGKKPMPQKGRLLQAVMEAGPLLQDLMVIGRLPRWRNPPRRRRRMP